ncbi:predicted protein [Naegleria gruberi]|uniref:Predicted protein n=1 Tax=Naegleria gruberi TaxID=5762 RepID=D2VWF3_NAEGR|nr:uncharacterized protein NAEGRDRAFT_52801 [Naegleria gruberi]EFC38827.1 predicted protein [Naegleria gruberi]|eukprot:XP_002671571.1 predicted protein [Naegleria gruberi strain NEG-M]
MGESEKLVKTLFEEAKKRQPAIIFIDEIDAVGSSREGLGGGSSNESISRLKTELLLKVQDVLDMKDTGIIVIGATNRPTDLDPALRRRFQKRIYIPLPDENARKQLFRVNLEGVEVDVTHENIDEFAKLTNQYSGADIGIIIRDALMKPVREAMNSDYFKTTNDGTIVPCSRNEKNSKKMNMLDIKQPEKLKIAKVTAKDIYDSIKSVKPSTNPSEILSFIEFTQNYGESDNPVEEEHEEIENQYKRKKDDNIYVQEIGTATVQKPKRKKYL